MKYLLLIMLLFPSFVFASLPVTYNVSREEVKEFCAGTSETACYFPTLKIILMNRDDLKGEEYRAVYYHELGHYYLNGRNLTPVFKNNLWYGQEMAADGFSYWIRGFKIDKKYSDFYRKAYNEVNLIDKNN